MTDPEHALAVADPAAGVIGGAVDQQGTPDLVKKIANEVHTGDMVAQRGD